MTEVLDFSSSLHPSFCCTANLYVLFDLPVIPIVCFIHENNLVNCLVLLAKRSVLGILHYTTATLRYDIMADTK